MTQPSFWCKDSIYKALEVDDGAGFLCQRETDPSTGGAWCRFHDEPRFSQSYDHDSGFAITQYYMVRIWWRVTPVMNSLMPPTGTVAVWSDFWVTSDRGVKIPTGRSRRYSKKCCQYNIAYRNHPSLLLDRAMKSRERL